MRHKKEGQARKKNATAIMKRYHHKQWKVQTENRAVKEKLQVT